MAQNLYRKRSKFHISDKEAQVIGDAFEQCGSQIGSKGVSVEQFADFCAQPIHPVHEIWKNRKDKIVAGSGRAAAAYLMSSVEIIIIHGERMPTTARAFTTIMIEQSGGKNYGTGYRSEDVANDSDLLAIAEKDMDRQVRGLAESFAAIAGGDRMYDRLLLIATEVRDMFTKPLPPSHKIRPLGLEGGLEVHAG